MPKETGQERARRNADRAMRASVPPLSAAALARQSGVDVKTVTAFLSGERWPQPANRAKISRALTGDPDAIDAWVRGEETGLRPRTLDTATELELARALVARLEARAGAPCT